MYIITEGMQQSAVTEYLNAEEKAKMRDEIANLLGVSDLDSLKKVSHHLQNHTVSLILNDIIHHSRISLILYYFMFILIFSF